MDTTKEFDMEYAVLSYAEQLEFLYAACADPDGWDVSGDVLIHPNGANICISMQILDRIALDMTSQDKPAHMISVRQGRISLSMPYVHTVFSSTGGVDGTDFAITCKPTEIPVLERFLWDFPKDIASSIEDNVSGMAIQNAKLRFWTDVLRLNMAPVGKGGEVRRDLVRRAQQEILHSDPSAQGEFCLFLDARRFTTPLSCSCHAKGSFQDYPVSAALAQAMFDAQASVPFLNISSGFTGEPSLNWTLSGHLTFSLPTSAHARMACMAWNRSDTTS